MKVLVDTCIWSHALCSKKPEFETQVKNLETLIADQRVLIIGAIRQEILSGYSDLNKFELLKAKLRNAHKIFWPFYSPHPSPLQQEREPVAEVISCAFLSYFENMPILDEDYITTAKFYNECRQKGVQGSHIDLLICAVAVRLNVQIFTSDKDFGFYQLHLPIRLYPTTT